jgi:hypothetical protein
MKKLAALMALAACALLFTTCKKGKDDPMISLLTRKARVVGDWRLTKGSVSLTWLESQGSGYNELFTFEGSEMSVHTTESSGPPIIYVGKYVLSLNFKKDGTFTLTETITGMTASSFAASGTWNFTSGVGKAKNKDGIVLQITQVTRGDNDGHLFNKLGMEFTYKITELRNKKMALEADTEIYHTQDGDNITYSSRYTFEAAK